MNSFAPIALDINNTQPYGAMYGNTRQSHDTMPLTFVRHNGTIISLGTLETYEYGASQSAHFRSGMDASSKNQEAITEAVPLRSSEKSNYFRQLGVAVLRDTTASRGNERRGNLSKTQPNRSKIGDIPKNGFDPLTGRQPKSGP